MRNVAIEVFNDPREPWGKEEFESLLRGKSTSYHIHHPFHVMMAEGKLPLPTPFQRLSTDRLMELGYPKVLWSKKYGVKYVMHRMYSRGGDVS